jgi:hypothetical protein
MNKILQMAFGINPGVGLDKVHRQIRVRVAGDATFRRDAEILHVFPGDRHTFCCAFNAVSERDRLWFA